MCLPRKWQCCDSSRGARRITADETWELRPEQHKQRNPVCPLSAVIRDNQGRKVRNLFFHRGDRGDQFVPGDWNMAETLSQG